MHLIKILSQWAKQQPEKIAYTFLENGETEVDSLTYQQLYSQVQAVGKQLQSQTIQGDRVLLLLPSGLEFIISFLGCLYAGRVAVPIYPPRKNRNLDRLLSIVEDAQPNLTLTTSALVGQVSEQFRAIGLEHLPCLAIRSPSINVFKTDETSVDLHPETLAFLQYTSGSTGAPKGVMVSHENILYNQQMIKEAFQHNENTIFVGWLPLFHDMGLIGNVLQPLYLGVPCILMSPTSFLQKPVRWLQAISNYRATTSGGPNFAYQFCIDRISPEQKQSLDLSCWKIAFNGAEPVSSETLSRFSTAFADVGFRADAFYPCYGMAETTLLASGGIPSHKPVLKHVQKSALQQNQIIISEKANSDYVTIVGCGCTILNQDIKIVDPQSRQPCTTGDVGEIWVTGKNVALGYWNRLSETQTTFMAQLAIPSSQTYLRTGDLGFLSSDGELFITGRLKDVIIIRGNNYYPQDIEQVAAASHPALRPNFGAAFSIELLGQEKLIVAHEVKRSYLRQLNSEEVMQAIRRAITSEFDLQTHRILLLKTNSIFKTSSGKIQRHKCRLASLEGKLNILAEDELPLAAHTEYISSPENPVVTWSQKEIQAWLKHQIAKGIGIPTANIITEDHLDKYGLDSVLSIELANIISETFNLEITPLTLVHYPTIEHLSHFILHGLESSDTEILEI